MLQDFPVGIWWNARHNGKLAADYMVDRFGPCTVMSVMLQEQLLLVKLATLCLFARTGSAASSQQQDSWQQM